MILYFRKVLKNIILVIILLLCINTLSIASNKKIVAYIYKQPVEEAELKREMLRHRAAIYSEYAARFNLSDIRDFWNSTIGGEKPIDLLRDRALKTLINIKVQQSLLEQYQLWEYKNYPDLLKAFREENEQRKQKVLHNEIIYGPVEYTEQSFFDYKFNNALILLKKQLTGREIIVKDSALITHFAFLKQQRVYSEKKVFNTVKNQVIESFTEKEYKKIVETLVAETSVVKTNNYWLVVI